MNQTFSNCQELIGGIFHLSLRILSTEEELIGFCRQNILHTVQHLFHPEQFLEFVSRMHPDTVYQISDELQIHYFLLCVPDGILTAGPFCITSFSQSDCMRLLARLSLPVSWQRELLAYRSQYPVLREPLACSILEQVLKLNGFLSRSLTFQTIDCTQFSGPSDDTVLLQHYPDQIRARYAAEKLFMTAVAQGNTEEALRQLRIRQREFVTQNSADHTLEKERIGCAIVRTMLRIAALNAGLSAFTVDTLSRRSNTAFQSARTSDDIRSAQERMVAEFCRTIQAHHTDSYSAEVAELIACLNACYNHPPDLKQLSRMFHLSPGRLSAVFKEQTGQTISEYLRRLRTGHAAFLLITTRQSISQISQNVGISDANYFVKLFRKDYGMTPTEYRSHRKL